MAERLQEKRHIVPRLLAIFLFSAFFVLFDWKYSSITILLLAVLAAVSMMVERNGRLRFRVTFFHVWMLLLSAYCYLSAIWAWDTENAITKGTTILSMFLCYSLAYLCYQEFDSVDALLKAVLWGGNIVMLVIVGTYGIRGVLSLLEYGDRLSEQFYLNSNVVGVLCAMSIVANIYSLLNEKRLHWRNLFIILGIIMVTASGSRQALAVMAGGIVLLLFLAVIRGKSPAEISLLFAVGILAAAGMILLISRLQAFAGIYKRMLSMVSALTGVGKTDHSATTRLALIDVGIRQFQKTPILGIGMGSGHLLAWKYLNRGYYLHNNFAEVLADGGLVGFLLYYSIYLYIFACFIRYRRYSSIETVACTVLLVMALVEDYASVTYYEKQTYFYLMLGFLESEKMRCLCLKDKPVIITLQDTEVQGAAGGGI